jgi:hypothetical protein
MPVKGDSVLLAPNAIFSEYATHLDKGRLLPATLRDIETAPVLSRFPRQNLSSGCQVHAGLSVYGTAGKIGEKALIF